MKAMDKATLESKVKEYRSLPNRKDLERRTYESITVGRNVIGMSLFEPSSWMVAAITFLKWVFDVESAQRASILAQKEGIEKMVIEIFMNEVK